MPGVVAAPAAGVAAAEGAFVGAALPAGLWHARQVSAVRPVWLIGTGLTPVLP